MVGLCSFGTVAANYRLLRNQGTDTTRYQRVSGTKSETAGRRRIDVGPGESGSRDCSAHIPNRRDPNHWYEIVISLNPSQCTKSCVFDNENM